MNSFEKNILSKIDKAFPLLAIICISVFGAVMRLSMFPMLSGDSASWLLPWYEEIAQNGLYKQVGDYNLVYQIMIWLLTKLPVEPLYAYKLLSCTFDYLIAIFAAMLVRQIDEENKLWNGIWAYAAVLICPTVFINSAGWAQCDAIYSAFAILGLYFLGKERYNCALVSLGMSFAFELHAVFILPMFLFVYFVRRKFSIVRFLIVPATMFAAASPILFWGRNLLDIITIYFGQTTAYRILSLNYPSFWTTFCHMNNYYEFRNLVIAIILFTICVLAALMVYWITKKYSTAGINMIIMAFLLSYTCVLFLPSMHERYGYMYEILAIILAVLIPKTIPLCIGLILVALKAYSVFLLDSAVNMTALSFVNFAIYVAYLLVLTRELKKSTADVSSDSLT